MPIAMSLAALLLLLGYIAVFGTAREPQEDEGTVAHIFQLLMGGQFPVIVLFMIKWLSQAPRQVLYVLALQLSAASLPMAVLFYFEH